MARIKGAVNAHKKRRKIMKLAKGYYGSKSKQYRAAQEQVMRSLRYAYIGRKLRKRDFRSLWIARINAATRINGMSYSKFICGLKKAGVDPQPQGAGRSGCERCGCVRQARRGCQERVSDCAFRRIGFGRFSFSFNLRRTKRGDEAWR